MCRLCGADKGMVRIQACSNIRGFTMATNQTDYFATDLWVVLKKEITGIQLQWNAIDELYIKPPGNGLKTLRSFMPELFGMMQTAFMESLLLRVSRLMDPASTGRGTNSYFNLSLKRLVSLDACAKEDEKLIRTMWDASGLRSIRDKYLSHNDLDWSMTRDHALTIPLTEEDIIEMRKLVEGLREFRLSVNQKLTGLPYVDQNLDSLIQRQVSGLNNSLLASDVFFNLLPSHEHIQQAWLDAGGD
jgi:hypothetical protein